MNYHVGIMMRPVLSSVCVGVFGWMSLSTAALALDVVASSKPVHSLTAAVMAGVGQPRLIVEGAASPHTFTMKPSAAKAIANADVFVRMSEAVEPFTGKIVKTLAPTVQVLTLADVAGIETRPRRQGGSFEGDGHLGHKAGGHDHGDDADVGGVDGHVWLDPNNARKMLTAIAATLARKSPQDADRFMANAAAADAAIVAAMADISARLKPLAGRPFVVFHDATQYFEHRFGLKAAGSITVSPDVQPSAKRLNAVRRKIKSVAATCVFREPGHQEKLMVAVTEGTDARSGLLDPEGLLIDAGPHHYVETLRRLTSGFADCLAPQS